MSVISELQSEISKRQAWLDMMSKTNSDELKQELDSLNQLLELCLKAGLV